MHFHVSNQFISSIHEDYLHSIAQNHPVMCKSDLDRVYDMLSIHFVKKSFCILFLNVIQKCLVVTSRNPYGENCHFFFCINFDKVINLVVKVNLLDKKVLCIGWVTYQATFHSLNEINWTYTFWDMIKFIRRGLTFLEGFSCLVL